MQGQRKSTLLLLALFVVFAATTIVTMRGQTQNIKSSPAQDSQKKAAEDFYTVTDYATPEPEDARKRASRQARAKRYNMPAQKGVDPKRFMITEERDSSFSTPPSHAAQEPALPVSQSNAVVIGDVTNADAFLAEDKTSIASEFAVSVVDILENNALAPVAIGNSIETIRFGGAVRFPSGKVIRQGRDGKPLPRAGKRYLFFLKYNNDDGKDFDIITAYELCAGQVIPLDGENSSTGPYAAYAKYRGADEWTFLNEVRAAINLAAQSRGPSEAR